MTVNSTLLVGQDPNDVKSFRAGAALEAYRLVRIDSSAPTDVIYPAAQFGAAFGITLHAAASGEDVDVAVGGFALLKVDGTSAIAIDDAICAHDNTGLGQIVAGGAAARRPCIGFALSASTADGDLISVQINRHSVYFAA